MARPAARNRGATRLACTVEELDDQQFIQLRGQNKTVLAVDTITFRPAPSGTEVTCTAEFTFKGLSRFTAGLLRPAFKRLGNQAAAGLRQALNRL